MKLHENHLKPLADALLPYSYVVRHYDEKTMVLRAGNGTEVKFETVSMKPVKATLSSEGDEWAIRQVADLLQNHPAFVFTKEAQGEVPWTIEFKESAVENFQSVRGSLLSEQAAPAAPPKEAPAKTRPKTEPDAPSEPSRPSPFRPTQPAILPKPKARRTEESKKKV